MSDVKLLNSGASDARVSTEMVANLREQVEDAERKLLTQRAPTYDEYIALYTRRAALCAALRQAEEIFGRNFKI